MKFVDNQQREWMLTINVAAMRRAKANGIDLSMPVNQLREFMMDDVFTCDALWAVVSSNSKERSVSQEQFESGIDGVVIETARDALWEALAAYYAPGKAEMLREAVRSIKAEMAKATADISAISNG